MSEFKTIEEIRKEVGHNQTEWAKLIGSTLRTYQGRLDGSQPKWTLAEIIKASEHNDGKISMTLNDETFDIHVKRR